MRSLTAFGITSSLLISAALIPLTASAQSAGYDAQVQQLMSQIAVLQQVLAAFKSDQSTVGGTVAPTSACPNIGRTLRLGMSGSDVQRLQQFLARDPSIYPEGQVSGYFGALTQVAVQRWQIKNNIVSSGTPDTTGFGLLGPRTAAAIALQCAGTATPSAPAPSAEVGGFIQVSPVTGDAPLQVSAVATVNTTNSCRSALYILDWSDDSAERGIPVSANTCSQLQQTYTHTYRYGGRYTITLSAGGHETSATVLVNGPIEPSDDDDAEVAITSPSGGEDARPGETMTISWKTSGDIPSGSSYVFDLYTGSGQKVATNNDVIAISSYRSGSISWTIPRGGTICPAMYPGGLCGMNLSTGSYRIHLKVYRPSTSGNTYGSLVAEDDSGVFTIISSNNTSTGDFSYQPLVVTPKDNPLTARATFDLADTCDHFRVTWGDGKVDTDDSSACTGSSTVVHVDHTYAASGTYTITLKRGTPLGHQQSLSYTIQN